MAVNIRLSTVRLCLFRCAHLLIKNKWPKRFSSSSGSSSSYIAADIDQDDIIDKFTTQLMQKKCCKWNFQQSNNNNSNNNETVKTKSKPRSDEEVMMDCNESHLNLSLQYSLEQSDLNVVKSLTRNYLIRDELPPYVHLPQILYLYAQSAEKEAIVELADVCKRIDRELYENQYSFKHYLAGALWAKGNISGAIQLYEDIYQSKPSLRRAVRLMLRNLIVDSVANGSQATLTNIVKLGKRFSAEYGDLYLLAVTWQAYFLSNWFSEQSFAIELLQESDELCRFLSNRIPYVVAKALNNHQVEIVYRLLEVLLSKDFECTSSTILTALFEYKLHQGDIQGCAEIVRWSSLNGITLPGIKSHRKSTPQQNIIFKF